MTALRLLPLAGSFALLCGAFVFLSGKQEMHSHTILEPPPNLRPACGRISIHNLASQQSNVSILTHCGSFSCPTAPIAVGAGQTVYSQMPRFFRMEGISDIAPTPPNGTSVHKAAGSVYIY